ncbi:actin, muscle-like [Eucalyptus grandis]|uniref:actin, muscle-like n=1 Tax=Eucalyptus grandis TaxID=71139 RepID=UPI00192EA958|nr:actin, muscle-like [Eucalyptus grandis]
MAEGRGDHVRNLQGPCLVLLQVSCALPLRRRPDFRLVLQPEYTNSKILMEFVSVMTKMRRSYYLGFMLKSGYQMSQAAPVYNGYVLPHAIQELKLAGRNVTEYLTRLLTGILSQRGYVSNPAEEQPIIREVKENHTCVALDHKQELATSSSTIKEYRLPDGQVITIGNERFQFAQFMFNPALVQMSAPGIHEITHASISKCNADIQKDLFRNMVLSGGSSVFPGMAERFSKEIAHLAPSSAEIKVEAFPERKYAVWIGGTSLLLARFSK